MPEPVAILTIAITTRALFHMEDSHALFEREGRDWNRFYAAARALADLPKEERHRKLKETTGA